MWRHWIGECNLSKKTQSSVPSPQQFIFLVYYYCCVHENSYKDTTLFYWKMTLLFLRFFHNGALRIITLSMILVCFVRGTRSIPRRISMLKENMRSASTSHGSDLEACLDAYRQLTSTQYSTCKYSTAVFKSFSVFLNAGVKWIVDINVTGSRNFIVEPLLSKISSYLHIGSGYRQRESRLMPCTFDRRSIKKAARMCFK